LPRPARPLVCVPLVHSHSTGPVQRALAETDLGLGAGYYAHAIMTLAP